MGNPRYEERRVDGARLRGKQQTIQLLENMGLQCGLVPNRFAMFVAAIGLKTIAEIDPEIAKRALDATRRELCDPSLTLDDVITAETDSLLNRTNANENDRIGRAIRNISPKFGS